jgi:sensor histidine kinase YesM
MANFILSTLTAAAMYIMAHILFRALYGKKSTVSKTAFAVVYGIAFFGAALLNFAQLPLPILNFAYMLVSICVVNKLLYDCKSLIFLLHNTLIMIILVVCDMSAFLILSALTAATINDVLQNIGLLTRVFLLNLLLLFVSMRIYSVVVNKSKKRSIRLHQTVFYVLLTVAQMYLLQYIMVEILDKSDASPLVAMLVIFLIIDIYIAFLLHRTAKITRLESELKLTREQNNMQSTLYSELSKKYKSAAIISHDIRKHITSLEGLIDNNRSESAGEYVSQLNAELAKLTPRFHHSNNILSVIVNHNLLKAEQAGISVNINVDEILPLDFVSDMDLTTILANAFDNAIESCGELEETQRSVKLAISHIDSYVLINVSNKFKSVSRKPGGEFASTKANHSGIGLTSMKSAVEKYNGHFNAETRGNLFIIKITLPINREI